MLGSLQYLPSEPASSRAQEKKCFSSGLSWAELASTKLDMDSTWTRTLRPKVCCDLLGQLRQPGQNQVQVPASATLSYPDPKRKAHVEPVKPSCRV